MTIRFLMAGAVAVLIVSSPSFAQDKASQKFLKEAIEGNLAEGCANLQSYQTPCVPGHVCECVQYTTVSLSWVDCRSYGSVSGPDR
jgi:hypothetical protein